MPTQAQIEQGAGMADYSELLARLSVRQVIRVGKDGLPAISLQEVSDLCAECVAAIRALIAERDEAVLVEREACAKVCEEMIETYRFPSATLLYAAETIRARSNA